MDPQQIRLFALGRDVQVGNLYNYYSDSIFSKLTFFKYNFLLVWSARFVFICLSTKRRIGNIVKLL